MTGPEVLVLWDVDNTLIPARGVGRLMYERAFHAAFGQPLTGHVDLGGRTELDIIAETLAQHGIEHTPEASAQLATALTTCFQNGHQELTGQGPVLPGALQALEAFAQDPRVHQGVLTANLQAVARIKLEVFGLDHLVDWDASAFGDDHADRAELVTFARKRAAARVGTFDDDRVLLIGDTPHDVTAALTAGVRIVAVATGRSSVDELREAGADVVLPDLTHLDWLRREVVAEV